MAERTSLEKEEIIIEVEPKDDPAQIRAKIEETRGEMSETIDALQEKLSVDNISEQVSEKVSEKASEFYETAKETVYDSTIGKAGEFMQDATRQIKRSGILSTVTENPLPLLLIAAGAGLLFFGGNDKRRTRNYRGYRDFDQPTGSRYSLAGNAKEKAENVASSAYDTASDVANSAYNSASNAAETVYDKAGNAVNTAYQSTSDAADLAMKKAGNLGDAAMEQYDYYIEENPLVIGAVALVAGALVGLAIPSTSYENRLVGEKRDNLLAQAKDTARDAVDKVKDVAGQAVNVATEEAKKQVSTDQTKKTSA